MANYGTSGAQFFHGTDPDKMAIAIAAWILTIDSTTHPILAMCPMADGVLVITGA